MYFPNDSITSGDPREEYLGKETNGEEESPASEGVAASEAVETNKGEANKGIAGQARVPPESEPCGERGVSRATQGNIQPNCTAAQPKELQSLQQQNQLLQPFGY